MSAAQEWLAVYLRRQGAVAGTVHVVDGDGLALAAAVNIPEPVLRATGHVPRGKGMAGLALERDQPVTTCNLQDPTKDRGEVRPGARAVDAAAAAALPVHDGRGRVRAVVGIAFAEARELPADELERLQRAASDLPLDETASLPA